MELLAKLEEEEGGQDLTREQLRGVILVLRVVLIYAMVVGRGGSVYRHCPRAHQLAFSDPRPRRIWRLLVNSRTPRHRSNFSNVRPY